MEKKSLFLRFSVMCLVKMKKMLILHHVEKNKNTSKIKKNKDNKHRKIKYHHKQISIAELVLEPYPIQSLMSSFID